MPIWSFKFTDYKFINLKTLSFFYSCIKQNLNSTFIILTQEIVNCPLIEFEVGLPENADADKNVGRVSHPLHISLTTPLIIIDLFIF